MNSSLEFIMYAAKQSSKIYLTVFFVFTSANIIHLIFFNNPVAVEIIMCAANISAFAVYITSRKGLLKTANHLMIWLVILYIVSMNIVKPGMYRHNFIILTAVLIAALSMQKKIIINYGLITLFAVYLIYFLDMQYNYYFNNKYFIALFGCIILFIILEIFNLELLKKSEELKNRSIKASYNSTLKLLGHIVELKDNDTHCHLDRVGLILELLLYELKKKHSYSGYITEPYIRDMKIASTMHDIGKIGVKDNILLKPDRLTVEEYEQIKKHTTEGARILEDAHAKIEENRIFDLAIEIARHHHERWDGKGYPYKLSGLKIPLSARTVAVADVYDALICNRPYKKAMKHEEAFKIIRDGSGTQFDPDIVNCFINIHGIIFNRINAYL